MMYKWMKCIQLRKHERGKTKENTEQGVKLLHQTSKQKSKRKKSPELGYPTES